MLDVSIFRQAVPSIHGMRTSPTKTLRYFTFLYYLQRLGMATRFPQLLLPYDIQRGTGSELDGTHLPVAKSSINVWMLTPF